MMAENIAQVLFINSFLVVSPRSERSESANLNIRLAPAGAYRNTAKPENYVATS
jgi:hypothetical protein